MLFLCVVSKYRNSSCAAVVWPSLWRDGEALLSFALSVIHCIFSCYRSQIQVSLSHLVLTVPCSTNSNIPDNTFLLKYSYCTCRKAFFTDLLPCIFQIECSRLTLSLKLHSIFLAGELGLISEPAVKSPDSYGGVKT